VFKPEKHSKAGTLSGDSESDSSLCGTRKVKDTVKVLHEVKDTRCTGMREYSLK